MKNILKRIELLEYAARHDRDGFIWVKVIEDGKYLVLQPESPELEQKHLTDLYGKVIDDKTLSRFSFALMETDDGVLNYRVKK